jgi:hypothetical protein
MIPYIQVHIQSWHMDNARKKPYHVLDSTYRIGNGLEVCLIHIRVIIFAALIPLAISLLVQDFIPG